MSTPNTGSTAGGEDKGFRIHTTGNQPPHTAIIQQNMQQSVKSPYPGMVHAPRATIAKTITTTTACIAKPHSLATNVAGLATFSKATKANMLSGKPIAPAPVSVHGAHHIINPKTIQTGKTVSVTPSGGIHAVGVTPTSHGTGVTQHTTLGAAQMASIIRGIPISQPQRMNLTSQAHPYPAHSIHVPRGPAAAISALTIPKHGAAMTAAVLRQIGNVNTTSHMSSINPQFHGRNPVVSSLRPGTPPSRPGSPSVVIPSQQQHTMLERLSTATGHPPTTTVQITIQPQRGLSAHKSIHQQLTQHIPTSHTVQQKTIMTSSVAQLVADSKSKIHHPQRQLNITQNLSSASSSTSTPNTQLQMKSSHNQNSQPVSKSLSEATLSSLSSKLLQSGGSSHVSIGVSQSNTSAHATPVSQLHQNIFVSQAPRTTTTVVSAASHSQGQGIRPPVPRVPVIGESTASSTSSSYGFYNHPMTLANYQHHPLVYQQIPGQQQQHPFTGTTTIRQNIQTVSHIAASLQSAAQNTTSATGGIRINPMQIANVDQARHISVQPHYPVPASSESAATNSLTNITTSPRPSILRKRPANDGAIIVKKCLSDPSSATSSPRPETAQNSNSSSPVPKTITVDPSVMTSQDSNHSSTDTASSAENSITSTPTDLHGVDMKIKQEPMDLIENGSNMPTPTHSGLNSIEASPRKKPRKQLLHANEELKDEPVSSSTDDEQETVAMVTESMLSISDTTKQMIRESFVDDEGVQWVPMRKRNNVALLQFYSCNWKSRNNHFLRHTDVKPKDERRPTVNELSNQKGVIQKAGGWKMYHLSSQMEDMVNLEVDAKTKIKQLQDCLAPQTKHYSVVEDDLAMVHELTQGNIQRCQLIADQVEEAKSAMMKILDHKAKVLDIVSKHHSKRTVKKKERC